MELPSFSSKYILTTLLLVVLWSIPSSLSAEVWSYACAEAMTLLSHAQKDVVRQHNRVYQSKLTLTLFPDGVEPCRNGSRGFAGGRIHCVNHRSHGGVAIKEVIQAQRMLTHAMKTFERRLNDMTQACSLPE
ncbi:hypothetical protein [Nitrospira sp. M1]